MEMFVLHLLSSFSSSTVVLTIALVLILYFWLSRPLHNLPPSPVLRLPIVGNLLSMRKNPRKQFAEWRKTHGDIFTIYLGTQPMVMLNGFDLIKEALVRRADVFSDRPLSIYEQITNTDNAGIVGSSGHNWKEQRTVSLSILRNFGMGKNLLAEKIQKEVTCYLDILSNFKEKPVDIRMATNLSISNIICSIIIGERFDYEDQEFRKLIKMLTENMQNVGSASILYFAPMLRYLPGDVFGAEKLISNIINLLSYFKNKISEIEKKEVPTNADNASNFITAYVTEKVKKEKAGTNEFLNNRNLSKIMLDLFAAGTETTSTTILWCVLYMMHFPKIQEKVFKEIESEVGMDRMPSMHDKTKLKYLGAVIMETQRLSSLAPLSVPHTVTCDVSLGGFTIPKGVPVAPNLDSILHDKAIWGEDADQFRPERFLDAENNLKNPEEFVPFSLGRRACLGEALAKMELFLFLSSMFQRFQFLPVNPDALPPLTGLYGLTCPPLPYDVIIMDKRI